MSALKGLEQEKHATSKRLKAKHISLVFQGKELLPCSRPLG